MTITRKLWEYKVVIVDTSRHSLQKRLNEYGMEGWEVVAHRSLADLWIHEFIMKRNYYPDPGYGV